MKVLLQRIAPLFLLLLCNHAFAALTVSQSVYNSGASPLTIAFGSTVAAGSVIAVSTQNSASCSGVTVSDNVNSGDYSVLASFSGNQPCFFWIVANATGTPTITVSSGSSTIAATAIQVTGFVGTPTADSVLTQTYSGTGSTLTASPITSTYNNEILLLNPSYYGANGSAAPSGWTLAGGQSYCSPGSAAYAIEATAGTTDNYSCAISSSETYYITVGGIYDSSGGVSSVTAGSSGLLTISPTTGAVVADVSAIADYSVIGNGTNSTAKPTALGMQGLAASLVAVNENIVSATLGTGPINDYDPSGWGTTVAVLYLTPASGGSTLDGLVAGSNMQTVLIINAEAAGGSDDITLENQSSSDSTAANRFMGSGNLSIVPGGRVLAVYLGGSIGRWSVSGG